LEEGETQGEKGEREKRGKREKGMREGGGRIKREREG
jgi:hypothetical protein